MIARQRHPDRRHAGDVLRGHRLPAPGLAGRRRRLRGRRAATAPPARHARGRRRAHRSTSASCSWPTARSSGRSPQLFGTALGVAAWVVFAPTLESAVDHRIDRLSLPWWLIATDRPRSRLLGATAAAWWPGRTVARLPVMLALSGRPPKPRPARHSAIAAAALIAVGIGCLALSDRRQSRRSSSPGSWRRSSAACSWARWRSASSPGWPGESRSHPGWRSETSSATRPAPERRSPPSRSPSASRRRSSSSPRPRRRRRRPSRPAFPTGKFGSTSAHRKIESSSHSTHARGSTRLTAGARRHRRPTRPGNAASASQGRPARRGARGHRRYPSFFPRSS